MPQGLITYEGMSGLEYLIEANVPGVSDLDPLKNPKVKMELRAKSLDGFPLVYYVYAHDNPIGFEAIVDTSSKHQTAYEIARVPYSELEFETVYYQVYKKKKRIRLWELAEKLNKTFEASRQNREKDNIRGEL